MGEKTLRVAMEGLREGMDLAKCHRCGCMRGALETLAALPSGILLDEGESWRHEVEAWQSRLEPKSYECLGCEKCYPADALNVLRVLLPEVVLGEPTCGFGYERSDWPPVPGEYFNLCHGQDCTVAVSTLASPQVARQLADAAPFELCIAGKTETENIGIEKLIKNTVTNPSIRYLLLAGMEPKGHQSGRTLLCLAERGVDEDMRILGSPAPHPVLRNGTRAEVEAFRRQVEVVDLIGCEDVAAVVEKVRELGQSTRATGSVCGCTSCGEPAPEVDIPSVIHAQEPQHVTLDQAGYFVILPLRHRKVLRVEHYDYQNALLHIVEGASACSLYWTLIGSGWVSDLTHAAYLGKELARAELSLEDGRPYTQDGAIR